MKRDSNVFKTDVLALQHINKNLNFSGVKLIELLEKCSSQNRFIVKVFLINFVGRKQLN